MRQSLVVIRSIRIAIFAIFGGEAVRCVSKLDAIFEIGRAERE